MAIFILANIITGYMMENAIVDKDPNLKDYQTANNVTAWLRLLTEPLVPVVYLYIFLNYGEKKSFDMNSKLKASMRSGKVSKKVDQGP
jgi:hypothetical protein